MVLMNLIQIQIGVDIGIKAAAVEDRRGPGGLFPGLGFALTRDHQETDEGE